ncbi:MAG TPA: hypothetical protein ENN90_04150, partial [Mariniphaga anaerophila]|nr:hypothetical protein [Mariniphaga anaerophila]
MKLRLFLLLFCCSSLLAYAQVDNGVFRMNELRNPKKRQVIQIPDVNGFQTLKCDLHTHTVFSDGHVWPNVRVQEAWQEGLDVLAITDHVEYTPHSEDVKVGHNRAWELAQNAAAENNLVFIKGTGKVTLFPRSAQVITAPAGQQSLFYEVVTAFVRSNEHLVV